MNNTKTRTIVTKLTMVAFLFAMVLLLMPMNTFAAKKPGQVKNIEEVKATDKSVTIKFKKVSGAKKYQVQVYEATRERYRKVHNDKQKSRTYSYKWKAKKKLVTKTDTKKTTCTVKGLKRNSSYIIKVRAYNGKSYGKWNSLGVWTTFKNIKGPGKSAATGDNLKKQYEKWKANFIKEAKEEVDGDYYLGRAIMEKFMCTDIGWTNSIDTIIENPNEYSMDEVYAVYKNGWASDMEMYHLIMDVCKTAGVDSQIEYKEELYESTLKNTGVGTVEYHIVAYSGNYEYDEQGKKEEGFALTFVRSVVITCATYRRL